MFACLLLILTLLDQPQSRLTTIDGTQKKGLIESITEKGIRFRKNDSAKTTETIPLESVERILVSPAKEQPAKSEIVTLEDNSQIWVQSLTVSDRKIKLQFGEASQMQTFETSTRNVRSVRLDSTRELNEKWDKLVAQKISSDVLIINRSGELENLEGIIQSVTANELKFKFNDQVVPVKKSRLVGYRFYHAAGRNFPDQQCLVKDVFGNKFVTSALSLDSGGVTFQLNSGGQIEMPLTKIRSFDFAAGRIKYVSDLPPESVTWKPLFAGSPISSKLSKILKFETDQSLSQKPLQLFRLKGFVSLDDEYAVPQKLKTFEKGIAARSGTRLIYKVPENFRRLSGVAGIDPSLRPNGDVELIVSGDSEELFRKSISGSSLEPTPFDISVAGNQRIVIRIGFGKNGSSADHLNICDLRFVK